MFSQKLAQFLNHDSKSCQSLPSNTHLILSALDQH